MVLTQPHDPTAAATARQASIKAFNGGVCLATISSNFCASAVQPGLRPWSMTRGHGKSPIFMGQQCMNHLELEYLHNHSSSNSTKYLILGPFF